MKSKSTLFTHLEFQGTSHLQLMLRSLIAMFFLCLFTIPCSSQQLFLKYKQNRYTIPVFKADTMGSFHNEYVKYKVVENIRKSKYDYEFRLYSQNIIDNKFTNIFIIKGNKDTVQLERLDVVSSSFETQNGVVVKYHTDGKVFFNVRNKKILPYEHVEDRYRQLIKNNFFSIKGSLGGNDFKRKTELPTIHDDGAIYYFEVKVGHKFRNFNYVIESISEDKDREREQKIKNIVKNLI